MSLAAEEMPTSPTSTPDVPHVPPPGILRRRSSQDSVGKSKTVSWIISRFNRKQSLDSLATSTSSNGTNRSGTQGFWTR